MTNLFEKSSSSVAGGRQLTDRSYGSWQSPVTATHIAAGSTRFKEILIDGTTIYWIEQRPSEGGRSLIVRCEAGAQPIDLTPSSFDVGSRVHEYGGGAYAVSNGTIYFSHLADSRLYRQDAQASPQAITQASALRYADIQVDQQRNRLICVCEDHTLQDQPPQNTLVSVALADGEVDGQVLVSGGDFYSSPCLSPDGSRLAWLTWDHPRMPWDGSELWVADILPDGSLGSATLVAGGPEESIFQPAWSPDGVLHFVSDRTGWWNLYASDADNVQLLHAKAAEFGLPQWSFGESTYAFLSSESIICTYTMEGIWHLGILDRATTELVPVSTSYTDIGFVRAANGLAFFRAGSPVKPTAIVQLDPETQQMTILCQQEAKIDPGYLSQPEAIEFPTANGLTAHGLFYPPQNPDGTSPTGELPPLLVRIHPGPTLAASTALDLTIQYWTSRGFGVLDVNFGGSTGYGRAYRQRLNGQIGILDVEDCTNGALYLAQAGKVDANRLAISGSSAGGFTALCTLTFKDVFQAGASYYGISNGEILAMSMHKFEAYYPQTFVGPYPECRDLYIERSPINATDRLSCPVIFFRGADDYIVSPEQTELMVAALREKGLPTASITFEDEGHVFKHAENITRSLECELYFYSRIFGFSLADAIEPITIENL